MISHSRPWITAHDVAAASECLTSGMVAQGQRTACFERSISEWYGCPPDRGVAVGSGAAAIVLALRAVGVEPGDEVVLPTYVCHTVMEAVRTCGARPVLCDVGDGWLVRPEDVASRIGHRTRALVVPHLYGHLADVGSFRRFGVPIVEDCAQAFSGRGAHFAGDVAVFSFHATKCLTTGEGGMALGATAEVAEALRLIRDGAPDAGAARVFSPLPDTSAALGLSQLSRYEAMLTRRRLLWGRYQAALAGPLPWVRELQCPDTAFRFVLRVRGGVEAYAEGFTARGVHVRRGVDRLNHRLAGLPDEGFPTSVQLFDTTLSLPLYPALTDADHERCAQVAVELLAGATRG